MVSKKVLHWLLEPEQPAVRYRTLTQLLDRPESDSEVRETKDRIPTQGWAAEILSGRHPEGWWVDGKSLYWPKYLSTNWMLLVLSDLGLTRDIPEIRASCELWMGRMGTKEGGVGGISKGTSHLCTAGNMARALLRFGYGDDARVWTTLEWLATHADPKGGWSCYGSGRNLDSWEGLSPFALVPKSRWNAGMTLAVERGAEFFLQRELYRQGDRYAPWFRFHYPNHYYYDLLVGLDLLTALGYTDDPRLRVGLALLKKKRRPDGRWNLDALHPDAAGGVAAFWKAHPRDRPTPFGLEEPGKPSKMITLTALTILHRISS
jgi:hypothetical protein